MSSITEFSAQELAKWKGESARAAGHLKKQSMKGKPDPMLIGFVFNDTIVRIPVAQADVTSKTAPELANHLYDTVLQAVKAVKP